MKKKSSSVHGSISPPPASRKPVSTLDDIHRKIVNSPVLNGGFDTLIYKVDKIEQSQGQLVVKVDKIHEAIYDPKDGMFAKLAEHKLDSEVKLNEISQNLTEINEWKKQRERIDQKEEEKIDESRFKMVTIEKSLSSLEESRTTAWSAFKWVAAALGGAIVTLIVSLLKGKFNLK